jgi:AraC-like DNA-binding protein
LDCGFGDQSHFTNVFRELVGMTPAKYRRVFAA